ncbi:MAG TPA: M20/M25/M40 family metallo-hydrolase [Candidatus Limiplasma sp.]|nr:M20/M25/M40 family metallo-hydrolase [Candidatus Limiplasma sp.]
MELKTLCEMQGLSGREEFVRKAVKDICIEKLGSDAVSFDGTGSVIAVRKAKNPALPRVMLAAHMDEVGLLVISATDEGLLHFRASGGIDARVLVSKRVKVGYGEAAIAGVIGETPIHLQTAEDEKAAPKMENLTIDIGAKDKAEAEDKAPLGTPVTFDIPYTPFGDGYVCAKALDDRVGVYNLLRLLDTPYDGELTFAFTSQEEVGLRGAFAAGYRVQPDIGIVLETTGANDLGDVDDAFKVCIPDKGPSISFMDRSSMADRGLFKTVLAMAKEENIPHQVKKYISGGNDAGAIQRAGAGAKTVVFSVPCRNIHSPASVCCLRDVDAQYRLAQATLRHLMKG